MIDVHCLIHNNDEKYFPLLKAQMEKESNINFYTINNGDNIGLGRVNGFLLGNSSYISYVDYDDLIVPGIFTKINEVMRTGIPWCYTDEILIDQEGKHLQPGWSSNPELFPEYILSFMKVNKEYIHHILTFRREILTAKVMLIMKQLKELSEEYLRTELEKYARIHIREVGYYWRQHSNNTWKKYEAFKNVVTRSQL